MLVPAIVFITLALVFYSVGVWAEKLQKILKNWHLVVFWLGFVCDIVGTRLMSTLVTETQSVGFNFHALTGTLAIILMLFHAAWATFVIVRNNEKMKKVFHKFSLIVWIIWLVPYISGMMMGMSR